MQKRKIYNINNEAEIRQYLGLEKGVYDRYWSIWQPRIKEVCKIAKEHLADYMFTADFDSYFTKTKNRYKVIAELHGITIFKEYKTKERVENNGQ